jgi:elongation factor 1-gamma
MSLGTIYGFPAFHFRSNKVRITAKYANVTVDEATDFAPGKHKSPEFLAKFPLGKVPTFEQKEWCLTESVAICYYLALSGSNPAILGENNKEKAEVMQWLLYSETSVLPSLAATVFPILGFVPYNEAACAKETEELKSALKYLENSLISKTYLVGKRITLADINMVINLSLGFGVNIDAEMRKSYPNVTRYFTTVANQPQFVEVAGAPVLIDVAKQYTPPKKEETKSQAS